MKWIIIESDNRVHVFLWHLLMTTELIKKSNLFHENRKIVSATQAFLYEFRNSAVRNDKRSVVHLHCWEFILQYMNNNSIFLHLYLSIKNRWKFRRFSRMKGTFVDWSNHIWIGEMKVILYAYQIIHDFERKVGPLVPNFVWKRLKRFTCVNDIIVFTIE